MLVRIVIRKWKFSCAIDPSPACAHACTDCCAERRSFSRRRIEMTQLPRVPDLGAQRAAMKKLSFLVGDWIGQARVLRGPGAPAELVQTEAVQYKLDGLLLMIEGVGRTKSGGQPALQALGLISFDDEAKTYYMRSFNNGRFLETAVALQEEGRELTWGFALEEIRTK